MLLIIIAFIGGMIGCGSLPIEIDDWYDLDTVRDNLRGHYLLMNDLDSATPGYEELASPTANGGKGWQPIAYNTIWDGQQLVEERFEGTFDGQGFEIRDLIIDLPGEINVGLFGIIGKGGLVEDVRVVNAQVNGYHGAVGSLVGVNKGTVSNSYAAGTVVGTWTVGGLVGDNWGTITDSYSSANVTGINSGGLVGINWEGTVTNSYSTASVTGEIVVGGLVGLINEGVLSNSCFTGIIIAEELVGGLVGRNFGTVSNSFWNIETSGQTISDGGTGKTTAEMQDIATFSGAGWNIIAVGLNETHLGYIWNIVNNVTYPFLSWQ